MFFARPKLLVSKCLGFAPCRYNSQVINDAFTARLSKFVDFVEVCPEVEIGLGVPRPPVRLVAGEEGVKMVQPSTGNDLTHLMTEYSRDLAVGLKGVDGFLLKSRSPSCGPQDVKVYNAQKAGSPLRRGRGMFAAVILEAFPLTAVEHEGRVLNFHLREHFLTKIFATARLRELLARPSARDLMEFQASNKLLLMAYNQTVMRQMGRLLAGLSGQAPKASLDEYARLLGQALARPPKVPAVINVCMHALGYFKKSLKAREKAYFLDALERYRASRAPLLLLQGLLTAWSLQFGVEYLLGQSFFQPYPKDLFDLADSGQGREKD